MLVGTYEAFSQLHGGKPLVSESKNLEERQMWDPASTG